MGKLVLVLLLVTNLYCVLTEAVVHVNQGSISGITLKSRGGREFSAFLGIPYAQPPIGELRFRSPVPKGQWNGTLKAHKEGAECPQLSGILPLGSEDCLYLNVYVPKQKGQKLLPVMVFIHGGGYLVGSSSREQFGPYYLMDKDIVLVTLNYRLGILGFLSTGDDAAPGNFGLKDQQLAMKWVKQNIRAFGGDSEWITLFGESAGSSSCHLHSLSKESKRYFNNYILQSGVAFCPWAFHSDRAYYNDAKRFAKLHNCPTADSHKLVNCLRQLPAALLQDLSIYSLLQQQLFYTWGPTIEPPSDTAFITESPLKLSQKNEMKMSPLMTGNCRDEGLLTAKYYYHNLVQYGTLVNNPVSVIEQVLQHSELPFRTKNVTALAIKFKNFYLGDETRANRDKILHGFTDLLTDFVFFYPQTQYFKFLKDNFTQPVYRYLFNYRGAYSQTIVGTSSNANLGISHADDLLYLFRITSQSLGSPFDYKHTPSDIEISKLMVDLWTSFATTSKPTSNQLTEASEWQPLHQNLTYLEIGNISTTQTTVQSTFFEKRMKFLQDIYTWSDT